MSSLFPRITIMKHWHRKRISIAHHWFLTSVTAPLSTQLISSGTLATVEVSTSSSLSRDSWRSLRSLEINLPLSLPLCVKMPGLYFPRCNFCWNSSLVKSEKSLCLSVKEDGFELCFVICAIPNGKWKIQNSVMDYELWHVWWRVTYHDSPTMLVFSLQPPRHFHMLSQTYSITEITVKG